MTRRGSIGPGLAALSLLAAMAFVLPGHGQEARESEGGWYLVSVVQVKPEMRQEWLDIQKKEVNPAFKKAGVEWRAVWETVVGDLTEYASVTPLESLSDLDDPGPLREALEPEERILLLQKLSKCLDGRSRHISRTRPDLSVMREGAGRPALGVVIRVAVLPGKQADFESVMKNDVLPVLPDGGVRAFLGSQTVFGGNPNEYVFLSVLPDFAELDKGPTLVRALGEEAARARLEKFAGLIDSVEYSVTRFNPVLSYWAE